MSCAARFHDNGATPQFPEKWDQLFPLQFASDHLLSRLVDGMDLESGFGGIQTNHGNAHRGWLPCLRLSRPAPWHIYARGGRPPHLHGRRATASIDASK